VNQEFKAAKVPSNITIHTSKQLKAALQSRGLVGTIGIPALVWELAAPIAALRITLALLEGASSAGSRRGSEQNERRIDTQGLVGELTLQLLLRKDKALKPGPLLNICPPGPGDDFSVYGVGFDVKTITRNISEAQINKRHHDSQKALAEIDCYIIFRMSSDRKTASLYCIDYDDIKSTFVEKFAKSAYYAKSLKKIAEEATAKAETLALEVAA
jgi:hypothetical protein